MILQNSTNLKYSNKFVNTYCIYLNVVLPLLYNKAAQPVQQLKRRLADVNAIG